MIKTGVAAALLNTSDETVRRWVENYGLPCERASSGHRLFSYDVVVGVRAALREGLAGRPAIERGEMLAARPAAVSGGLEDAVRELTREIQLLRQDLAAARR